MASANLLGSTGPIFSASVRCIKLCTGALNTLVIDRERTSRRLIDLLRVAGLEKLLPSPVSYLGFDLAMVHTCPFDHKQKLTI